MARSTATPKTTKPKKATPAPARRGAAKRAAKACGLPPKLEAFAQHLALHDNQTEAYVVSHEARAKNLSRSACRTEASKLAREPEVAERVNELRLEMARVAKEQFELDAAWVLRRLHEEVTADIAALYDESGNKLLPVHEWPEVFRTGLVNGIDTELRTDAEGGTST